MSQDIIEINGKKYDAISGKLLNHSVRKQNTKGSTEKATATKNGKPDAKTTPESAVQKEYTNKGLSVPKKPRQAANHLRHHAAQSSKTLNRKSVTKPSHKQKTAIKTNHSVEQKVSRNKEASLVKLSTASIKPERAERAKSVSKSDKVKRFNLQQPSTAANYKPAQNSYKPQEIIQNPKVGKTFDIKPPKQQANLHVTNSAKSDTMPDTTEAQPPKSYFTQLVEQREQETHHRYLENPRTKKPLLARLKPNQKKLAGFASAGLMFVLATSFLVYHNKTNIEMQLASAKAGFSATLPSYQPNRYSVGELNYKTGLVVIDYKSSDTPHHFKLTQKAVGYTTGAVLSEVVSNKDDQSQVLRSGGRTIYVSRDNKRSDAVWLDNGVMYRITGDAGLSNDQLKQIAAST